MNDFSLRSVIVVGAGPAGLMAAEQIALAGYTVDVYDAMPSAGRKFLLAGKSGMNLSHAEEQQYFVQKFGKMATEMSPILGSFDAEAIRAWALGLGINTFVGSSGRIFPVDMKAAPLLRAWLQRLRGMGVRFHMRHKCLGWAENGDLLFQSPDGQVQMPASATVFALGGASWKRLGSDAAWLDFFRAKGIQIAEFEPSNCGFNVVWSDHIKRKFAGTPLTSVVVGGCDIHGRAFSKQGQFVISEHGVEGSLIYALSAKIREKIRANGPTIINLDLLPGRDLGRVTAELDCARGARSLSTHLKSKLGLHAVHIALMHECLSPAQINDPEALARGLKSLPVTLVGTRPIDEAISSAGGVTFDELDAGLMLKHLPGVFCAGEMLDWEAPTGGYLLSGCFATGLCAGRAASAWLTKTPTRN